MVPLCKVDIGRYMRSVTLKIEGKAVGKGRPRFTKFGHAYTPKKTREYEEHVKDLYKEKYGAKVLEDGPLKVNNPHL